MPHGFSNRVWVTTPTIGTGNVAIGDAMIAYCTPAQAGTPDGAARTWLLEQGNDFELFRGAYNASTATVERGPVLLSQIAGVNGTERLGLVGAATLRVTAAAEDMLSIANLANARSNLDMAAFGPGGTVLQSGSANDITKNGFYSCSYEMSDLPSGYEWSWWTIIHQQVASDPLYATQLAIDHTFGQMQKRFKNNGVWRPWASVITADQRPPLRNYIINGDFDIWQRGISLTSVTGSNYLADRWRNLSVGSTMTITRNTFAAGQTDVPGESAFFERIQVGSVAGAGNIVVLQQYIEDVRTLAGKQITITFYAYADAAKNIALEIEQYFGVGGSASVSSPLGLVALTSGWKKIQIVMTVPNIGGKTIGTMSSLNLNLWFDAGSTYNARASSLGQRSGFYGIAHVSVVEGDARGIDDPFSRRHIQQELALCQRYYEKSYNIDTPPGTVSDADSIYYRNPTEGSVGITFERGFAVPKRAIPTVTIYNPATGATGSVRNASSGLDVTIVGVNGVGQAGFRGYNASAGVAATNVLAAHFTADAEL
ncbi:MAG TPA: pyocin knob domain-containing protein [Xanthobacteraceae bacterium]|nr:pyocin knob domain-containing protein [Xanthobacteraceae bacterium]